MANRISRSVEVLWPPVAACATLERRLDTVPEADVLGMSRGWCNGALSQAQTDCRDRAAKKLMAKVKLKKLLSV